MGYLNSIRGAGVKGEHASPYPLPLTYIILGTSTVFSAVSTGLLAYFTYYLNMDSMSVPWEFIIVSLPRLSLSKHP
jgi:hypothetical protein